MVNLTLPVTINYGAAAVPGMIPEIVAPAHLPPLPEGVHGIRLPVDGDFNGEITLNRFMSVR
jgi:hypothetical protein